MSTTMSPDETLEEFMATGWAAAAPHVGAASRWAESCARRRSAISAAFPGQALVVPAGRRHFRANDIEHPFRAASDFVWLTGYSETEAVLVMEPGTAGPSAVLYVPPRLDRSTPAFYQDRGGELWVGPRLGLDDLSAFLGIEVAPAGALAGRLRRFSLSSQRVRRGVDPGVDEAVPNSSAQAQDRCSELARELAMLRFVKDPLEIAAIQSAVDTTQRGFEDVVAELPAAGGVTERWLDATFVRRARSEGGDAAYPVIAAAGSHACILHWASSHTVAAAGDLLLLDAGAEGDDFYAADVTRTMPVSGSFTPPQRDVYDAVLAAREAAIAECRPGNDFLAPHRAATAVLSDWLVDRGLLPSAGSSARPNDLHRRFTLHGTSHALGLDVHDCAAASEDYRASVLAPGMVFTVEPGCYIQPGDLAAPARFRGIGVRIEDDVVITEEGSRVLSATLPTQADDVERWMDEIRRGGSRVSGRSGPGTRPASSRPRA